MKELYVLNSLTPVHSWCWTLWRRPDVDTKLYSKQVPCKCTIVLYNETHLWLWRCFAWHTTDDCYRRWKQLSLHARQCDCYKLYVNHYIHQVWSNSTSYSCHVHELVFAFKDCSTKFALLTRTVADNNTIKTYLARLNTDMYVVVGHDSCGSLFCIHRFSGKPAFIVLDVENV
jgi:hypothetical protein